MSLKDIQKRLLGMGYNLGPAGADGEWGRYTETALGAVITAAIGVANLPAAPAGIAHKFKAVIPLANLPKVKMKRIHIHWTGGAYTASDTDKDHYHFLIDGHPSLVIGVHSIEDNVNVSGKTSDEYAAHTKNANTGAIGISICSMGGAVEHGINGRYPISAGQFDLMVNAVAQLAAFYSIPVTDKTILTHAEVQPNLGITQNGKWDITVLPFDTTVSGAKAVGDKIRAAVKALL